MHALITGANRGIGAALADSCRQAGARVTATARSTDGCEPLDVTDPTQHAALAQRLEGRAIDLLICNAGIYNDKTEVLETGYPPQLWAETLAINVTGVFLTIQTLLPNLKAARQPKIAIISSQMGSDEIAAGGKYIYRASKAAALNLGRNLAVDLKPQGIAVGIYHPGWVRTDMGGGGADITVEEASAGLMQRFADLSLNTTGCFENWDGRAHPF